MTTIEKLVRTFARRTTQNGHVVLVTNGQPALVDAFHDLGWSDPYPDPELLPKPVSKPAIPAVTPSPKGPGR